MWKNKLDFSMEGVKKGFDMGVDFVKKKVKEVQNDLPGEEPLPRSRSSTPEGGQHRRRASASHINDNVHNSDIDVHVLYSLHDITSGSNVDAEVDDGNDGCHNMFSLSSSSVNRRSITVGDVKRDFPLSGFFIFRFKMADDDMGHVWLDGLYDSDIAPTFHSQIVLRVVRLPSAPHSPLPQQLVRPAYVTTATRSAPSEPLRPAASAPTAAAPRPAVTLPPTALVRTGPTASEQLAPREELVRQRLEREAAAVKEAQEFATANAKIETEKRLKKLDVQQLLSPELDKWALTEQGKYKDVRTLLSTIQAVLWSDSGWVNYPLGELMVNESTVKKAWRKAVMMCHPDKHQAASAEQQYRADRVFNAINEAFKIHTGNQAPPQVGH